MKRWLDDLQLRSVRMVLRQALDMLPDPDAPVHAHTPIKGTLCGRGGRRPVGSSVPAEVTCKACRAMPQWEPWAFRRAP